MEGRTAASNVDVFPPSYSFSFLAVYELEGGTALSSVGAVPPSSGSTSLLRSLNLATSSELLFLFELEGLNAASYVDAFPPSFGNVTLLLGLCNNKRDYNLVSHVYIPQKWTFQESITMDSPITFSSLSHLIEPPALSLLLLNDVSAT